MEVIDLCGDSPQKLSKPNGKVVESSSSTFSTIEKENEQKIGNLSGVRKTGVIVVGASQGSSSSGVQIVEALPSSSSSSVNKEIEDDIEKKLKEKTDLGDKDLELVGARGDDVSSWPHPREHCMKFPVKNNGNSDWSKTCDKCMCYVCETFTKDCENWLSHCKATDNPYWRRMRESHKRKKKKGKSIRPKVKFNFHAHKDFKNYKGVGLQEGLDFSEFQKACVLKTRNNRNRPLRASPFHLYQEYIRRCKSSIESTRLAEKRDEKREEFLQGAEERRAAREERLYDGCDCDSWYGECDCGYGYSSEEDYFQPYSVQLTHMEKCHFVAGKMIENVTGLSYAQFEKTMKTYFKSDAYKQLAKSISKEYTVIKDETLYIVALYLSVQDYYFHSYGQLPFRKASPLVVNAPKDLSATKDLTFLCDLTFKCELRCQGYGDFKALLIHHIDHVGMIKNSILQTNYDLFGFRNAADMFATKIGRFPDPKLVSWLNSKSCILPVSKREEFKRLLKFSCDGGGQCKSNCTCKRPLRVSIHVTPCASEQNYYEFKFSVYFNSKMDENVITEINSEFNSLLEMLFPAPTLQRSNGNIIDFDFNKNYKECEDGTYSPSSDEESEDEEDLEEPLKVMTHVQPYGCGNDESGTPVKYLTRGATNYYYKGKPNHHDRKPKPHESNGMLFFKSNEEKDTSERSLCASYPVIPLVETMEEKQYALEGRNLLLEMFYKGTFFPSHNPHNGKGLMQDLNHYGYAEAKEPPGLTVALRDYQKQDLQFMLDAELGFGGLNRYLWFPVYSKEGKNTVWVSPLLRKITSKLPKPTRSGFLCDEMGLGKTVVTLGLVISNQVDPEWLKAKEEKKKSNTNAKQKKHERRAKGTLVVCHVSLVAQWISEATRMSGGKLKILKYYGTNRKQDLDTLCEYDIVVTTYAVFFSDNQQRGPGQKKQDPKLFVPPLERAHWWRIVLDESHSMQKSLRTTCVTKNLKSRYKWCVTGTPMNKNETDIYQQLKFLRVTKRLGDLSEQKFLNLDSDVRLRILQSCMIRHEKLQPWFGSNVLSLPEKTEQTVHVTFSSEEKKSYETECANAIEKWKGMMDSSTLAVRSLLGELRMICSMGSENRRKAKEALISNKVDPVETISSSSSSSSDVHLSGKRKADDDLTGPKQKKQKSTNAFCLKQLESQQFSKFNVILNQLRSDLSKSESGTVNKVLMFTEYQETLHFLSKMLDKENINHVKLHGGMSMEHRKKSLESFKSDPTCNVFIASTRAAGVGINIMAANKIYLVEPNENASLESQAIGRCWRFGQKRAVTISRFVYLNSIEEKVLQMRGQKAGNHPGLTKAKSAYVQVGEYLGIRKHDMEHVFPKPKPVEKEKKKKKKKKKSFSRFRGDPYLHHHLMMMGMMGGMFD